MKHHCCKHTSSTIPFSTAGRLQSLIRVTTAGRMKSLIPVSRHCSRSLGSMSRLDSIQGYSFAFGSLYSMVTVSRRVWISRFDGYSFAFGSLYSMVVVGSRGLGSMSRLGSIQGYSFSTRLKQLSLRFIITWQET